LQKQQHLDSLYAASNKKNDDHDVANNENSSTTGASMRRTSPPFMQYTTLLGRTTLVVLDPDIVKLILTAPSSKDPVRFAKNYFAMREVLGHGLVTLEGSAWSRHRRLIQPSFHIAFLKEHVNRSAMQRTQVLIEAWQQRATAAATATPNRASFCEVNVAVHMSALTLDIIGDVAFAHDFGACRNLLSSRSVVVPETSHSASS
jgi:cytochrome P450